MSNATALTVIAALLAVMVWFDWTILRDIANAPAVRLLTRQQWAILCLVTSPIGGLLYLRYGRYR
jgi:hypothetical protein